MDRKTQNNNDFNQVEVSISVTKTKSRNEQTKIQLTGQSSCGHIGLRVAQTQLFPLPSLPCPSFFMDNPGFIPFGFPTISQE